jgi:serine/alanine adding enzyme
MSIEIVRDLPQDIWCDFLEKARFPNIFHTPEMFEVLSRTHGHTPRLWGARQDGDVNALLLPVEISVADGILQKATTRAVVYGGPLISSGPAADAALRALLSAYRKTMQGSVLFTELRNLSDRSQLQPILQANGFKFEPHTNYVVDLDLPIAQIWKNINRSTRKSLTRAGRENLLSITTVDDPDILPEWYRMIQMSFHRAHAFLADISLFQAAWKILYPKDMVQFLICRLNDTPIAASVALLYKQSMYGWYRGYDSDYAEYRPNDQMVLKALKWGAANGYKSFDFGGAGRPGQKYGPRDFKAKFGGVLVNYGRDTLVHSPLRLQLSRLAYSLYRRVL